MIEYILRIRVPKFLLNLAHKFRVGLNSIYSDEHYGTGITLDLPLEDIELQISTWGCELNRPNQYKYPDQVSSGHLNLKNGKQFHVRVYKKTNGYELKAHVEWHGVTHPILHMLYANLDYIKGYKMLKNFIEKNLKR